MVRVLFVCTGNICRSAMAEGLFRHAVGSMGIGDELQCDSAGLIDYHAGNPPDSRAIRKMRELGIDISTQRSRQVVTADFQEFDWMVAMDSGHLSALAAAAPDNANSRIVSMLDFAEEPGADVPDPYYGDYSGFTQVAELLQPAIRGLIRSLLPPRA